MQILRLSGDLLSGHGLAFKEHCCQHEWERHDGDRVFNVLPKSRSYMVLCLPRQVSTRVHKIECRGKRRTFALFFATSALK